MRARIAGRNRRGRFRITSSASETGGGYNFATFLNAHNRETQAFCIGLTTPNAGRPRPQDVPLCGRVDGSRGRHSSVTPGNGLSDVPANLVAEALVSVIAVDHKLCATRPSHALAYRNGLPQWVTRPCWAGRSQLPIWTAAALAVLALRSAHEKPNGLSTVLGADRAWLLSFGLNKQLDLQTLITTVLRCQALAQGWYAQRRAYQSVFLVGLFIAVTCSLLGAALYFRRVLPMMTPAVLGTILIAGFVILQAGAFYHEELGRDFVPSAHPA